MGIMSTSKGYTLNQNADTGVLTVASQNDGLVNGLTAELSGAFNGGLNGSVGMSHTLFAIGVPLAAAAFQKKQLTGGWSVPFMA